MGEKAITITLYLSIILFVLSLVSMSACSIFEAETKTCTTTCFSKSTGANLGSSSYEDYTKEECEEALKNRQTILTECTMEWE